MCVIVVKCQIDGVWKTYRFASDEPTNKRILDRLILRLTEACKVDWEIVSLSVQFVEVL